MILGDLHGVTGLGVLIVGHDGKLRIHDTVWLG